MVKSKSSKSKSKSRSKSVMLAVFAGGILTTFALIYGARKLDRYSKRVEAEKDLQMLIDKFQQVT